MPGTTLAVHSAPDGGADTAIDTIRFLKRAIINPERVAAGRFGSRRFSNGREPSPGRTAVPWPPHGVSHAHLTPMRNRPGAVLAAFFMLASPTGFAVRPFNTDDARIVDPGG
jgi:hypothetical protein